MAETPWSDAEDSRLLGLVLDGDLSNLSCRTIRDMSSSQYSLPAVLNFIRLQIQMIFSSKACEHKLMKQ